MIYIYIYIYICMYVCIYIYIYCNINIYVNFDEEINVILNMFQQCEGHIIQISGGGLSQ